MSEPKAPIIDVEEVSESQDKAPAPKKKNRLKLHLYLVVILGAGTWVFWTFSPYAQHLKQTWLPQLQQIGIAPQSQPISAPVEVITESEAIIGEEPVETEPTPIFEDIPENTEEQDLPSQPDLQAEDLNDITIAMQDLQQQVINLQQTIGQMQTLQLQWSQQQVRAQLFAFLRQASSPQSKLDQIMIAWKSISFMPLINQGKRDTANQAYDALQGLQNNIVQTTDEISSLITTLAEQLQPKDLDEVAQTVENLIDPYQQTDVYYSWLDWLQEQFMLTKLDEHALNMSDDPYADLKQLISDLNQLKQLINQHQWNDINSLNSLLYRLEQRGFEINFTRESIEQFKQEEQAWQQEAQAWMAQL